MKVSIKDSNGITLVILIITVAVMLILAGVAINVLKVDSTTKRKLESHSNNLNELVNTSNTIQENIQNELINDYNKINTQVENDSDLSNAITTDDWNGSINKPKLLDDMTAIYFENGTEKILNNLSPQEEWNKWYDYSKKNWANAKTSDGSYWVWIPRFAYKITSNIYTATSCNISIVFIDNKNQNSGNTYSVNYPDVINNSMTDYVVHPAFGTNIENGGNNKVISGFWVAKYEMSREDSPNGGETWAYANGTDVLTKNAGATSSIRTVSKPGVSSWRNISIGNAYSNSYYYNRVADSHMIKNSEWGAITYLAHSAYGRDGVEITKNNSNTYTTGTGGVLASTTGNESGVYDLNGGAFEYISAYILNSEAQVFRNEYGSSFATNTKSTEYLTIYPHNTTSDTAEDNWSEYNNYKNTRFGDALLETSIMGSDRNAWNSDICIYPHLELSFFVRGGKFEYTDASSGIFMFGRAKGDVTEGYAYRIILF